MKIQEIGTAKKPDTQAEFFTTQGSCPLVLVLKYSTTEFYPFEVPPPHELMLFPGPQQSYCSTTYDTYKAKRALVPSLEYGFLGNIMEKYSLNLFNVVEMTSVHSYLVLFSFLST